jgi:DNA-binding NarL/FixJ family response regulator
MAKLRVFLIEDNRLLREGIAAMLKDDGNFDVVARTEDGDAIRQLKEAGTIPDVVLLDLGLEKANSLKLMLQLRDELPEAKVIAMDILPEQVDMIEFVQAGGAGFILKSAPMEDYIKTIKLVAAGTNVLPPVLTTSLFTQIVDSLLKSGRSIPDDAVRLTPREKEIVDLISEGLSNKEIAKRLHIATYTVKSHVHNILEKLALSTRLEIAAFARKDRRK